MRLIVRAAPPAHLPWLIERAGFVPTADLKALEAAEEASGRIRGMVGYCNWTPNSVQCHIAADTPAAWRALVVKNGSPAFRYPFLESGRGLLLALIRASNTQSLALTRHFGFRETYRIQDAAEPGDDMVLFEMRREECRWLDETETLRRAA